jgi:PAS domain S-box-containing protein
MDAQLCKKFMKIIPHAAALLVANDSNRYELVECNQMFGSMFGISKANIPDVISAIQISNNPISQSLISSINDMMKHGESEFSKEESGYSIVLSRVSLNRNEYLLIMILSIAAEMQSSIKNYESIYNAIDDMIMVANKDGTLLFSNSAVSKKLGYTKDKLNNMHILDLFAVEIRKEAEEILADMLQHKRDVCRWPLLMKDGRHLPVETRIWFGDWNGKERLFGISRALSNEQKALQTLFDRNPACITMISIETGLFTRVNHAFLETFGFSENEVIGKTPIELGIISEMEYDQTKKDLLSADIFNNKIMKVRKKTGEIMFVREVIECYAEKLLMTIMVDLTEQMKTQQQLAYATNLHAILIDLSSRYINCSLEKIEDEIQASLKMMGLFINADRVYIFNYNHQTETMSNTFEWCNTSIESRIEYLQDIPSGSFYDWVEDHKKGEPIIIPNVSEFDFKINAVEESLKSQHFKSLIIIPMMYAEKYLGFVGFDFIKENHIFNDSEIDLLKFYTQIIVNIHLRKIHEHEMSTARVKAEKSNEAKNYFIAKTSHELRNLLNGAWGFINLLSGSILEEPESMYVSNIIISLSAAIRLLNDLLDIAKIENNELLLTNETIRIFDVINESITLIKPDLKQRGIHVDIKFNSDTPINLVGDPVRLKQIIGNLLTNAATHARATEIEVGCTLKSESPDAVELLFFVKDNGIGISKEAHEKIFDLFSKIENGSEGAGLGLPICMELVKLMGGKIWIESAENKGSVFYFTIPFLKQNTERMVRKARESNGCRDLKGLRILLVEDNYVNQLLVIEMLKPKEIFVTAVQNGVDALKALESNQYDLILMDIQMPVMDGLETIKRIRAAKNPIPIIALTGAVLLHEKESYINIGANEVVEKPILIDILLEKILLSLNDRAC